MGQKRHDPAPPRSCREVFEDHLRKRKRGEVEEDLSCNYSEEVVLLTSRGVFRGKDAVRRGARLLEQELPGASFEYRNTLTDGEVAFLEWTARCARGEVLDGADSFLIRDGRIVAQTIHYTVHPNHEAPPAGEDVPPERWSHRRAVVNGLTFHYVEAGSGPPVILLHGFPEFWYSWRRQIPALADAGFRVLAPDLRGYNETDRPAGVGPYRLEVLADDVAGLIAQAGAERAAVVGHDWGGVVAWHLAMTRPEVVEKLVVLNAPHPAAFRRELGNPVQWLRSSYALFFQLPWLPERVLRAGDYSLLRRALRRQPVRPGAFTPEDIERYRQALGRPGALTAALNYYRAALRRPGVLFREMPPISAPTLLIWGERDPFLGVRLTEGLERWVPDLRVERLPDASHWVQNDAPERVNRLLLEFLRPHGGEPLAVQEDGGGAPRSGARAE